MNSMAELWLYLWTLCSGRTADSSGGREDGSAPPLVVRRTSEGASETTSGDFGCTLGWGSASGGLRDLFHCKYEEEKP